AQGGPVNFFNIKINPPGNGTHTECVGHIAREFFSINGSLKNFHFPAKLLTVFPIKTDDGDRVIFKNQLEEIFEKGEAEALILRTMPNDVRKLHTNYSGANPPYLHHEAVEYLVECGVEHLLLDLPSVDREEDGGKLLAHKAFWKHPDTMAAGRQNCTITELIFVDSVIKDGLYLLNLQIASFELDASPSKPVLFRLERG
ncbi:MAG TPA: cyclase family protein, partial [Saprospiraceae bacterium]|nr:cyclase family protein [Saprospiraceae bacterium]